jgi:hypothetical protein
LLILPYFIKHLCAARSIAEDADFWLQFRRRPV